MPTRITANAFRTMDIQMAKMKVAKYRQDLIRKCDRFVKALANKGIIVGQENVGEYGKYITFTVETESIQNGWRGYRIATQTGVIKSQWMQADGSIREADVSPLLMAEFGAGLRAERSSSKYAAKMGMGTGTFPGQTHAFDPEGWYYKDLEGNWHHSYGVYASMPMYHAYMEMYDQIAQTAREVFWT